MGTNGGGGHGHTLCSEVHSTSWKGAGSIWALPKSTGCSSCCSSHARIWGGGTRPWGMAPPKPPYLPITGP